MNPHNGNSKNLDNIHHLNLFLIELTKQISDKKISMIYRGDKLESLFSKLGVTYNYSNPNYNKLMEKLCIIGEKSNHFLLDVFQGRMLKSTECGEEVFEYIFDYVNKALKSKNPIHIQYFEKNVAFKEYFKNKSNKAAFINEAMSCSLAEKLYFKNIYLRLLHQLASQPYKSKSHYSSTTLKYSVAKRFAINSEYDKGFVLHMWQPNSEINPRVKNSTLPKPKGFPYAWQKEVSVLAGVFPHYIVALEIPNERILYNPYIFNTPIEDYTFINGLFIDQSSFYSEIKNTSYRRWFSELDNEMIEKDVE